MGQEPGPVDQAIASDDRTPEQIEAEIARTREDLGDTVAAMAAKADVKAQARAKFDETRERIAARAPRSAHDAAGAVRANRRPLLIGGAALAVFLLGRRSASR
jgi:hypothetical protein